MRVPTILALAALLLASLACAQETDHRPTLKPDPNYRRPAEDPSELCSRTVPREADKDVPQVEIVDVRFQQTSALSPRAQDALANELKQREYQGEGWTQDVCERARDGWMRKGYFEALPGMTYERISGDDRNQKVAVTLSGEHEGQRYRLGQLTFKNTHAFNAEVLRRLFPIRNGEVFNIERIREGLEHLRVAYGGRGYINFTSVPDTVIDRRRAIVDLVIDLDEGRLFLLREVTLRGHLDQSLRDAMNGWWAHKMGKPYNGVDVDDFVRRFGRRFPNQAFSQLEDIEFHRDEASGAISLVFRLGPDAEVFTCGP
jgi:outer membrane protein assembly factor BamA